MISTRRPANASKHRAAVRKAMNCVCPGYGFVNRVKRIGRKQSIVLCGNWRIYLPSESHRRPVYVSCSGVTELWLAAACCSHAYIRWQSSSQLIDSVSQYRHSVSSFTSFWTGNKNHSYRSNARSPCMTSALDCVSEDVRQQCKSSLSKVTMLMQHCETTN